MPSEKHPKAKSVESLRHAEYYDMQRTFDELYTRSQAREVFDNLMELILSKDNIMLAYRNIKSNSGSATPGTDRLRITDIGRLPADEVVARVRKIVRGGINGYTPRSVRRKEIPKPNGKTRPLGIPCIWDRLIQQCIKQVMEPICEAKFSSNSYGFRPNRSVENAIAAIYRLMQRSGLYYVVEFDVKGFFDNAPLVERLHGQVIHISPSSTQYINPMDINANYSEEDNPLALKADFILSLCELVVGGKEGLKPVEKTVIDRCVHKIYAPYFEHPCPETVPMLEDLYNALLTQDEPEAHHVAAALEIYVKGSLNIFNHRTNVDIDNRIVCFDIKQLGKQLKKLGMLIVQDQVWGRVTANRSVGKSTRYYADEFHLLLKDEQTAAYSVEIWKRFRKWGGIPTALTQNVKDLLASPEVSNIFENSDFVYMLNQANGDRQILAKQLNISPHQLSYVTHSGEGEGLLFFGNVILPFVDHFPKDLELYRILTTRLSEVVEAKHE